MRRQDLEHILRSASVIAGDLDVLIVGSQSILGSYDETDLPDAAYASIEVDVTFFDDPDNTKSDTVDGLIGEDSMFHAEHGYYAQGVDLTTAVLPAGWRDRIVPYTGPGANGATGHCLDVHDLVVSKLVAYREKDFEFAHALLQAGLVDPDLLIERAQLLAVPVKRQSVVSWVLAWKKKYE
ncbi:DUF6036 family nucleotidyltransferase [Nocardioides speluncae]|uniref:DUF6036 family nucleotidyltransferase n=1 Tax=Nocardioides speluncae TaxID=2670337 RepID=UPI000D69A784|nr:DUF6036 family nucleotidyltransferase [Nocardioides speluncae]